MNTPKYEKSHLESKKFVAWLVSEMTWKLLLGGALWAFKSELTSLGSGVWWLLMSIVITAGFIEIGFILGQAALDRYVRVAEIAANELRSKLGGGDPTPPPANPDPEPTDPKVTS